MCCMQVVCQDDASRRAKKSEKKYLKELTSAEF
jgi:hypothetical protein